MDAAPIAHDAQAHASTNQFGSHHECPPDEHPVLRNRARLPTPPIKQVFNIVARTVLQRDPGCCFVAHPRFGKTSAITVLRKQLALSFPNMPTIVANAKKHPRFSENVYYSELLEACAHLQSAVGKVEARRMRFFKYLWTLAQSHNSDCILMFVDEAQNWYEAELSILRDLSNDLALEHDIILIVVFFGQPELASVRTALLQSKRIDLIGRFMIQQYEFHGLGSLSDLEETMDCYDDPNVSEFPEGSGISYSEFLLGQAFRSGWRLKEESGRLWDQFKDAAQAHGGLAQVGMQWVASSIRNFFVSQMEFDHPGFKGTPSDWATAVAASGFVHSLGVTYAPDTDLPLAS